MKYYANPLNVPYRYQFNKDMRTGNLQICREAADPSMILFKDKYYIFASMTLSYWESTDLVNWQEKRLPDTLPLFDYAPDVRVIGDYVYYCASARGKVCNYYRTKDFVSFEEIQGTFDFWDPDLFLDDDGRLYFYWGCNSLTPIWGVELDPITLKPRSEKYELIWGNVAEHGFERVGEDHSIEPAYEEEIEIKLDALLKMKGLKRENLPEQTINMARGNLAARPYIEGAWMTKHDGKYYLQYACPGAQYNTYCDGVYIGESPLGPFTFAKNNPYSYKPGGFIPGAGHGSTMKDKSGNLWHVSTMCISKNHIFERRAGLFPAGFDKDGDLFCNQRYADWVLPLPNGKVDPWANPEWYLLSYGKSATASSYDCDKTPDKATDENVQTWWRASSNTQNEWLQVDLGKPYDVRAIQVNFADDGLTLDVPGEMHGVDSMPRYIDKRDDHVTRWILEGSQDGINYFVIADKSNADTNLCHDMVVCENGITARFVKLTIKELPFNQTACVSGLRVFGKGNGDKPLVPKYTTTDLGNNTLNVKINGNAVGYNILWGYSPDKLYHSYMVFKQEQDIKAVIRGQEMYMRIDAFNENGITEGIVKKVL